VTDTTSNTRSEGEQTAATIDATASAWGLPAAGETIFDFDYTSGRDQLLRLYDKGTRRQWVASDRIDWNVDVDWENPLGVPDESVMLFGTPFWERMNDRERGEVRRHQVSWQFSQFLHGEQGALMCASKIVNTVPTIPTVGDDDRGVRAVGVLVRSDAEQLSQMVAMVDRGELRVDVAERVPLAELAAVHARAASGELSGRVIVVPDA